MASIILFRRGRRCQIVPEPAEKLRLKFFGRPGILVVWWERCRSHAISLARPVHPLVAYIKRSHHGDAGTPHWESREPPHPP